MGAFFPGDPDSIIGGPQMCLGQHLPAKQILKVKTFWLSYEGRGQILPLSPVADMVMGGEARGVQSENKVKKISPNLMKI